MKVVIEVDMENDAFGESQRERLSELKRILQLVLAKVQEQMERADCLCTAPEAADRLKDINGNTVGKVTLTK